MSETLATLLAPVRLALLADADDEVDRIVGEARHDADALLAAARAEVDAELARARERAETSSAALAERELGLARRNAEGAVMRARSELKRRLEERVAAAVAGIPTDPRYPRLIEHLTSLAHEQLGAGAVIVHDASGGIVATDGPRRVDYRLDVLAERAMDTIADEVVELWT